MADVNANIGINLETSAALAQLKALQRQLAIFNTSISKSSATAITAQKALTTNLVNAINDTGKFVAELKNVDTTVESFSKNLEKNKFSVKEYFKYAGASTKTFGRMFSSEFDTINKVAEDRVKRLQTQYIKLGRDASGTMQAISVMPKSLDMSNYGVQMQMGAQRQALFNQLVKQGTTGLINFGKNTQWAGRQLMVGFTIPLMILGSTASKTFMEMEKAAISFRKVYGDLFTPAEETKQALENITELGKMFTKYGIAVTDTINLAAQAAAAGFEGIDLQRQTTEATRLSVLGQMDVQKSLETTISLQNAFKISSEELASSINFLNAVENQTVLSLDDVTEAIPRVGPIIQQLGGNVKDLAFFLTAMKEGGVSAAQGANALKSGLASLIGPSDKAAQALMNYGINIKSIVESNQGNLRATVVDFAKALDTLDPLNRSRAIEQLFGKFQFARISALFNNITEDGTQASRVLDLAGSSLEDLAKLAENELGVVSESSTAKFKAAMEQLKLTLIPLGEEFLKAATPIVEFLSGILEKFSNLSDGTKRALTIIIAAIGGLAPIVLMSFGLLNNLLGNALKFALTLRQGYLKLTGQSRILSEQTNYLTLEQTEALAAAHSLNQSHAGLTQVFNAETGAIQQLIIAYQNATKAAFRFAQMNPGLMLPGFNKNSMNIKDPNLYNKGVVMVPGSGNQDTVPAMLTPGEAVIPSEMAKKYAPLIEGMISGNIPGYKSGRKGTTGNKAFRPVDSYDLGHFAAPTQMTGREVQELSKNASKSVQAKIEQLIASTTNGLDKFFDVFSNQVVVQSKELNQKLKQGSAPIQEFRQEALDPSGAYHAPLLARMESAGASQEELKNATIKLTSEIDKGISELGNQTEITAKQVDQITQKAYDKVSKTNNKMATAYKEMKKPSTLKEQFGIASTGGRTALRDSYTSRTNRSRVQRMTDNLAPGRFAEKQGGLFTVKDAQEAGFKDAEAIRKVYQELDVTARREVDKLIKNTKAMSSQVRIEAEKAGIDIGKYTVQGIGKGVKSSSPSKETIRIGQGVAKGLEIGMQQGKSGVARAGNQLRDTAITSSGLIVPRGAVGGSGGSSGGLPPTGGGVSGPPSNGGRKNNTAITTSTQRLGQFNNLLMGGTFALTSLAGAGMFAGGKIGELSNQVFKFSGLLFGLMSITQLLTQAKVAELVASRLATAKQAASFATYSPGLLGKVTGNSGLLGTLSRLGVGIARFIGPIGALIGAVTIAYGVFKFFNDRAKKEAESIKALGDASKLTSEQVKTLGDFFGVVPQKLPSEMTTGLLVKSPEKRTQLEQLKESEDFQKNYKKTINALKLASDAQSKLTLQTVGLELSARGFATEQIQLVIDALREEAGKVDVEVDFKSFNIEDYMQDFSKVSQKFENEVVKQSKRIEEKIFWTAEGQKVTRQVAQDPTKQYKKQANIISTTFSNAFDSISGRFRNGVIDSEQYRKEIGKLEEGFANLSDTTKEVAISKMLLGLDEDSRKAVESINNVNDKLLILKATLLGLEVAAEAKGLSTPVTTALDNVSRQAFIKSVEDQIAQRTADIDKIIKQAGTGDGNKSGTGELSEFDKKIKETLQRLQLLANASINTSGGIKELNRVLANGAAELSNFNGIQQQLLSMGTIGLNREFIEYISGLDEKSRAAFINVDKLKKGQVELTRSGKTLNKAMSKIAIQDMAENFAEQTQNTRAQIVAFNRLRASGLSAAEALEVSADANFAHALATAGNSREIKRLIRDFRILKKVQEELENLDPEKVFSKQMEAFDKEERDIELDYAIRIMDAEDAVNLAEDAVEATQKEIEKLEDELEPIRRKVELEFDRPIEDLQRESTILSNELTLLDRATEEINNKYNKQADALNKIHEINQNLIAQEKSKISLADALTRGDISAAAQAIKEYKATEANTRKDTTSKALEFARESEINRLRSISGKTRLEIETRQFSISQQIFKLEQDKLVLLDLIRSKEDNIYKVRQKLEAAENNLYAKRKILQDLEDAREKELRAIQRKRIQAEMDHLKGLTDVAQGAVDKVKEIDKSIQDIKDKTVTITVVKKNVTEGGGGSGGGTEDSVDDTDNLFKDVGPNFKGVGPSGYEDNRSAAEIGRDNAAKQDAATARRAQDAQDAKALADGAAARAKNAVQIANAAKQNAAAAARGGTKPATPKTIADLYRSAAQYRAGGGMMSKVKGYSMGGKVKRYSLGGIAKGTDTVPAMLTPGEFVMRKYAVKDFGLNNLKKINNGTYNDGSVYNYNLNLSVKSESNPDEIAETVIAQIKRIDSQRIRGNRN